LALHETLWQEPLTHPFLGYEVATAPPNSWGLALLMMLHAIEGKVAESKSPTEQMLGEMQGWEEALKASQRLVCDPAHGEKNARTALADLFRKAVIATGAGRAALSGADTTCVCVMDRSGNAVSLIQSVSSPFGSGLIAAGTGIVLNNRMRGFNIT